MQAPTEPNMENTGIATRSISRFLILCLVFMGIHVAAARAQIIGTGTILDSRAASSTNRARVRAFLERKEVRAEMLSMGVNPKDVSARVNSLTNAQVADIAGRIGKLPAGGDFGGLLFVGLVVFLVLLYTDIMGYTDVFPFVKKHAR